MGKAATPINYANLKYISPDPKKKGGIRHLRGKLKYFSYRNDKSDHIPHQRGKAHPDRWVDMGLGKKYGDILKACQQLQGKDILAWTWVISPTPALMALVPEELRQDLVKELTENIVTEYYEARSVDVPPYSYVLHDRDTKGGEQQLHTHVVLPGTVETLLGRDQFFNNEDKGHIALFNQIADAQLELSLDRAIGSHWRTLRQAAPEFPEMESIHASGSGTSELERWFGPKDAAPDFEVPTEFAIEF